MVNNMIYIQLFYEFFKIGLFSFGGGYAMIPLISDVLQKNAWLSYDEVIQIIGIAEMTPGPIAVNSATFVGFKIAGIFGSVAATLGVAMPSLLLILFISKIFFKYSDHEITKHIFIGIRPIIAGLILASALLIGKTTLFTDHGFNIETFGIMIIIILITLRKKIHPILLIGLSGVLGYLTLFI